MSTDKPARKHPPDCITCDQRKIDSHVDLVAALKETESALRRALETANLDIVPDADYKAKLKGASKTIDAALRKVGE